MRYTIVILATLLLVTVTAKAQKQATDSLLSYQYFINQVLEYHPLSKIADMEIDRARAVLLDARAGFEPTLNAVGNSKTIDSKNYWDKRSAGIKMATPFAAKLKSGYETADGDFLNPENSTAESGQWFAEIELPLLRGLLTDKRRIQLRKAENVVEASQAQRRNLQNELLVSATNSYWNWQFAWNRVELTQELLSLARTRHRGVVVGFQNGDFAVIDTVESYNQWLNRAQQLRDANIEEINARADLNSYLWQDDLQPLDLPQRVKPDAQQAELTLIENIIKDVSPLDMASQLPQAEIARIKRDNKALEYRLARENLKPELNVAWKQFASTRFDGGAVDIKDNQVGLTLKVPLFMRSSRAQSQLSQIQLNNAETMLQQKLRDLSLKILAQYQQAQQLEKQQDISNEIADNFFRLAEAEVREFNIGESSLFLVNQRENKYQESRLKAFNVEAKFHKNLYKLYWLLRDEL